MYIERKKPNIFNDYNCPVELCLRLVKEVAVIFIVVEIVEKNKSMFHIDSDEYMLVVVMDQT